MCVSVCSGEEGLDELDIHRPNFREKVVTGESTTAGEGGAVVDNNITVPLFSPTNVPNRRHPRHHRMPQCRDIFLVCRKMVQYINVII